MTWLLYVRALVCSCAVVAVLATAARRFARGFPVAAPMRFGQPLQLPLQIAPHSHEFARMRDWFACRLGGGGVVGTSSCSSSSSSGGGGAR